MKKRWVHLSLAFLCSVVLFGILSIKTEAQENADDSVISAEVSVETDEVVEDAPIAKAEVASGMCGENVTWTLNDKGVLTISGKGDMYYYNSGGGNITPWYDYLDQIIEVKIGDEVTSIGGYAFWYCNNLKNVVIPKKVKKIGYEAFSGTGLESITIPGNVITVEEEAFSFCKNLKNVTIQKGVTEIGSSAFGFCDKLEKVTIPDSVITIGDEAFWCCKSLEKITIPKSIKNMGIEAFSSCDNLTEVTVQNGVPYISEGAFSFCENLKKVSLPASVKQIRNEAFYFCPKLEAINVDKSNPNYSSDETGNLYNKNKTKLIFVSNKIEGKYEIINSVTTIGEQVFYGNDKITSITIPGNVKTIETFAFSNCSKLKSLTIPASVVNIAEYAFSNCDNLTDIKLNEGLKKIGRSAFSGNDKLKEVSIPDSVTELGIHMFQDCINLKKVKLPKGLTAIGEYTFCSCENLSEITIPDSVEIIYDFAFYGCKSLKKITIPDKVTRIESAAFIDCQGLENIIIPDNVTYIGFHTFSGCTGVKNVILGKSVKTLEDQAFGAFFSLEKLVFTGNAPEFLNDFGVFYKTTTTCYYPKNNPTWTEEVMQDYGGTITWVGYEGPLYKPTVASSNVASSGKIKLEWDKVAGASKYNVYSSSSQNGTYKLVKTTTNTNYTNTSAVAGKKYYYYVEAVDSNGKNAKKSAIISRMCDLARPTVTLSSVASSGKIKLSWKKVEGAKSYKVYRSTSENGKYTLMKTVTGTSMTNSNAKAGTKYFYKVMAIAENTNANSAYSAVKSRVCDLSRPTVTIKKNNSGKPKLSWKKIEGATKYQVYRATKKNGEYSLLKTVTGTSMTNTNAKSGKTYYYKVKAIHKNTNANSAFSTVVSMKVK